MSDLRRTYAATFATALTLLAIGTPARAQGAAGAYRDVVRLGGTTSFDRRPLTNAASVKRMADGPGMVADIQPPEVDTRVAVRTVAGRPAGMARI